jgi:hypothetical protein
MFRRLALERSYRRRLQTAGEIAPLAVIASRREDPSRDPRERMRLRANRLGQALAFEAADTSIFERVASGPRIDASQRGASAMAADVCPKNRYETGDGYSDIENAEGKTASQSAQRRSQ